MASVSGLGGFQLGVYGLALAAAILALWLTGSLIISRKSDLKVETTISQTDLDRLILWIVLGFVIGGHTGHIIFTVDRGVNPERIFALGNGGMSSYGSLLGIAVTLVLYFRRRLVLLLSAADLVAIGAPLGILAIRLANYNNSDVIGTVINGPWVQYDLEASRHPVALYEAGLEGGALFALLLFVAISRRGLNWPGLSAGIFVVLYTTIRWILEGFRESEIDRISFDLASLALVIGGSVLAIVASFGVTRTADLNRGRTVSSPAGGDFLNRVRSGIAIGVAALVVPGCGEAESPPNSGPAMPLSIVKTNPGAEPQCTCTNATGAYIVNGSNRSYRANWVISIRDTISGQMFSERGSDTIDPGVANKRFIGCSQYAPATSCRFHAQPEISSWGSLSVSAPEKSGVYGAVTTPSISTCVARCTDPNGECLKLGTRFYKGIAPLAELISQAASSGGSVKKADILTRYGLPASFDKCNRGDVQQVDGRFVNVGNSDGKVCLIPSENLPKSLLDKLGLPEVAASPTSMITSLPRRVEAVKGENIAALSASDVTIFDASPVAPTIVFDGAGSASLTGMFGGPVLASARISLPSLPKQTVVATGNGCIAVDEP